ncbi:MAG: chloride channel protein, partial [Candidatus Micrarchaeota archaeon]|nr:chloride channel protein [Candidatus Micrarchaeota archaeon]
YLGTFIVASLPLYVILGIVTGLMAILYIKTFYAVSDKFKKLGISNYFKPAIGAFVVGLVAIAFPEILSTGYGWVQLMINGNFASFPTYGLPLLFLLIMLPFAKIFVTSLTIGSGGSGGVFGPGMFIGATIGAVVGVLLHLVFPTLAPSIAPFVIIGMLAFFGGAAKVPIAMLLMVTEMTGSLQILPAAMIALAVSYLVSGKHTIYKSQIPERRERLVVQNIKLESTDI